MFIDLSPLKNTNFRKLFFGQLISSFGSQMTAVVIPFQIYFLTESVFWTGMVSGVEFCFLFTASLLGGVLADVLDRKKLLIFSEFFLCIIPLCLALNASLKIPSLAVIFLLAGFASFLNGLHRPALEALTPQLVAKEELSKISALSPMRHILTTILSPMIGGFLIVYIGPSLTYLIDSATFLASLLFLFSINYKGINDISAPKMSISTFSKEIVEGISYLKSRPDILGSYVNDFIAMVFCNPVALFPALASSFDRLDSLGFLYAFPSIGALMMTLLSRWTIDVKRCGVYIVFAACSWSVAMVFVGIAPSFEWILFGLFFAGYFDMMSGIFRTTIWNETIPQTVRGRMAGFEMLSYTSGPLLGNMLLGFFADIYGIQKTLAIASVVALVLLLVFNRLSRNLWQFIRPIES